VIAGTRLGDFYVTQLGTGCNIYATTFHFTQRRHINGAKIVMMSSFPDVTPSYYAKTFY
jgi:hypothetical protein